MKAEAGSRITWRGTDFEVLVVRALSATLRTSEGEEIEVSIEELNKAAQATLPPFARPRSTAPTRDEDLSDDLKLWLGALERLAGSSSEYRERGRAVADEAERLSRELGKRVSIRTMYRKLRSYQAHGIEGVVDQRSADVTTRRPSEVDPRVLEALNTVLAKRSRSSTVRRTVVMQQVSALVRNEHGDEVKLPSRASFFRLLAAEDRGRFSFGSAKTKESLALSPEGAFGRRAILRPGEHVQIDTTRLDVLVRIDEATIGRPELTIMIDVATRSILAAVLRPESTKSVDLVVVLARALVPYERRPEGARETRRLISTAWAEEALIGQERFERLRVAQPYIFPETITTDNGRAYLSSHFRAVCQQLGISLITAAVHTPTDKAHVERTFASIASLFLQYAKGYVGRNVDHRGADADAQSEQLLTIAQMQELLEDWIAVEWQNRSQDGLRDPLHPTIVLSPNEMCRAFREYAPELHIPLSREDFVGMLPVVQRRINRYGITIDHRVYDSDRLNAFRRTQSPSNANQGKWPIRVDPYNLHVVWLDVQGEFIPLRWANDVHDVPMLGDVWRAARHAVFDGQRIAGGDVEPLVTAMRSFAGKGNTKKDVRRKARRTAVADDPMSATRVLDTATPAVQPGPEEPPKEKKNSGRTAAGSR